MKLYSIELTYINVYIDNYADFLRVHLTRLIAYAESSDVTLQREVAEKIANEAVKSVRQVQIVEFGGLKLLIPLTKSVDAEVQRLASHALANLSVNADNQRLMANNGAIESLIPLLETKHDLIQRQAAKALANLGVNAENKRKIALAGGIPKLVHLCRDCTIPVKIECIAALANLAVNDENEMEIIREEGHTPILQALQIAESGKRSSHMGYTPENMEELCAQCCRSLRNLSVNHQNKAVLIKGIYSICFVCIEFFFIQNFIHAFYVFVYSILGGALPLLLSCASSNNDRVAQQAHRALRNLNQDNEEMDLKTAASMVTPEGRSGSFRK